MSGAAAGAAWRPLRGAVALLAAGIAGGALAFGRALGGPEPERAWLALLVNLLFAAGVAQGGILFSVLLRLTRARVGLPLVRLAESGLPFLLLAPLLILAVVGAAGPELWPWLSEPRPDLGSWLTRRAVLARSALVWGGMAIASLAFVRAGLARGPGAAGRRLDRRAILVALACLLGQSLVAFDLIQPLAPGGRNALLGGYYVASSLFGGLAAVAVAARFAPAPIRLQASARLPADLRRLLAVLAILVLYLLAAQLLTIWYGNLRMETGFLFRRLAPAWFPLTVGALGAAFLLPALVGAGGRGATSLAAVALLALAGLWLERYILVAPSLRAAPALGGLELAVTAGVLSLLLGGALLNLRLVPVLPVGDPRLGAPAPEED